MQVMHRRVDSDTHRSVVWLSDRTRPFVIVLIEADKVDMPLRPFAHLGVGCRSRDEVDRLCRDAASDGRLDSGPTDSGYPAGYWAFSPTRTATPLKFRMGRKLR